MTITSNCKMQTTADGKSIAGWKHPRVCFNLYLFLFYVYVQASDMSFVFPRGTQERVPWLSLIPATGIIITTLERR